MKHTSIFRWYIQMMLARGAPAKERTDGKVQPCRSEAPYG